MLRTTDKRTPAGHIHATNIWTQCILYSEKTPHLVPDPSYLKLMPFNLHPRSFTRSFLSTKEPRCFLNSLSISNTSLILTLMKPICLNITVLSSFLTALFLRFEFILWVAFPVLKKVAQIFLTSFIILETTAKLLISLRVLMLGNKGARLSCYNIQVPIFKSVLDQDYPFYSYPFKSYFKN